MSCELSLTKRGLRERMTRKRLEQKRSKAFLLLHLLQIPLFPRSSTTRRFPSRMPPIT